MPSYDRRTKTGKVMFESVVHKAAEAANLLHQTYGALHSFKFGMDEMEEIPAYLQPLYDQTMKALGALHPAMQEADQLEGMTSKVRRQVGR
jgi:hypothetical protein